MLEHHAFLAAPLGRIFDALEDLARKNDFPIEKSDKKLKVKAPLGHVTLVRGDAGADVIFGAASPAELQMLKDLYAQRFAKLGIGEALRWRPVSNAAPLNQMLASVVSAEQISPNFMRLRLAGDFSGFQQPGAGLHFRLLFGPEGAGWPFLDDRGLTQWPGGQSAWHRPPFTVRALAPDASWLDVDIVLHDGGRVTNWCRVVKAGEEIALHGPSGSGLPKAQWLGLIGDETALPVMMRIIEGASAGVSGRATILVRAPSDAQAIETASDVTVRWAIMGADDPVAMIRELAPPHDDFHIFFAAERSQAASARAVFKEMGFPSTSAKAASYWTVGGGHS